MTKSPDRSSDLVVFLDKISRLGELEAYRKGLISEIAPDVGEMLGAWLREHPGVESLRWTQYTPYFNDGEACIFSVQTVCLIPHGADLENKDPWDYADSKDISDEDRESFQNEIAHLFEFDDVMLDAFGDHVSVTVRADSVVTEEYSHD